MAQTSGTFPGLNAKQRSAKQNRFLHAKAKNNTRLPALAGRAPAPRVPGGLAAHRAAAHAKARGGKGC